MKVTSIKVNKLGQDFEGKNGSSSRSEIIIKGADGKKEKAILHSKKSIFSDTFKVRFSPCSLHIYQISDCLSSPCKEESLSPEDMSLINSCNFEGKLTSDPESRVHVTGCFGEDSEVDLSIITNKVKQRR